MVATVLKLRYRILGNTLSRRPWQLVGFCFGILWALWMLVMVAVAAALIGTADPQIARTAAVLGGSALLAGWVIGPVLIAGTDTTVDAVQLAPFPFSRRQTMLMLAGVGLTGIPGIVTTLASLSTVSLWLRMPAAAVIAVPCAAVAVVTCVIASRLMSAVSAGLGNARRGRELIGTVALVLVILAGPLLTGILALIDDTADIGSRLQSAAGVLGWTPLGAAWAVPGDVAAGQWLLALARLAIAIATPIVLWLVWAYTLSASVSSPPHRAVRAGKAGALGLFGVMPTGPTGATWARSLSGWLRDPRYLRQLLIVPLFPVLFAFTGGVDGMMFQVSAVMVAFILAIATYADISYDGTAFASVLATGIRGRADRLGRMLGAACLGIPLVVIVAVATGVIGGTLDLLPAVLGAALGTLLVGYGVGAVSSALIVSPVAAPGDSPFKSVPGQTFVNGLLVFVVLGACLVLSSPAIGFAIWAATSGAPGGEWIALAVGVVLGVGLCVAGVFAGGRILDRTGPSLLARIKAFPTS